MLTGCQPNSVFNQSPCSPDKQLDCSTESATNETAICRQVDWSALVAKVQAGDIAGMEQLYAVFSRGMRYCLQRQVGPENAEDKMRDTFLAVVKAIQRREVRVPELMMRFVHAVMRRQAAAHDGKNVTVRRKEVGLDVGSAMPNQLLNPEQETIIKEKAELMKATLQGLSKRDREILVRFYLREQRLEQICRDMSLTETQFGLAKNRAKFRLGEIGRKGLGSRLLAREFGLRQWHSHGKPAGRRA
jgi:RNA polymerase sigma-70 factor (ECF subfamily)